MSTNAISERLTFYTADIADRDLLLEWANDPEVRAASGNRPVIGPQEHRQWFDRIAADEHSRIVMVRLDGAIVGAVRVLYAHGHHDISWTVAPDYRQLGIGKQMVSAVTAQIKGPMRATVDPANPASIKIALSAGFRFEKEKDGVRHYTLN